MRFSNYFLILSSASFDKYKNSVTLLLDNFLFHNFLWNCQNIRRISKNYSIISKNKRINKRSKLLHDFYTIFFFFHFSIEKRLNCYILKDYEAKKKNRSVTRWKKKKKVWPFLWIYPSSISPESSEISLS